MIIDRKPAESDCPACGHKRRWHSKDGCTGPGCSCTKTYMDLSPGKR